MAKARTLIHPGPVAGERIATVPCVASHRQVTLKAGSTLLQAMVDAVGEIGAWFDLDDIRVETLAFVRPAPAPGDGHVAWYSAQTVLTDAIILKGGAHLGRREGAAFAHIHGLWSESDGTRHAGHLLAEATVLSGDHLVNVWVLDGAILETAQDAETGFPLFRPVATGTVENRNAVLATIRPNMQLDQALITSAEVAGLQVKVIRGLGSLVGAYWEGQSAIIDDATEVLLTSDAGLGAIAVGFSGPAITGNLAPNLNRVCVTFEVLLLSNPA